MREILDIIAAYAQKLEGICAYTLAGHFGSIACLAVLPDGKLVSGSDDCTVRVWEDGVCLHTLAGHTSSVYVLAVLPSKIASGSQDTTVRLWKNNTCSQTLMGHSKSVTALGVLPDGHLASGSHDCTVRVWDTVSGVCLLTLVGHTDWVCVC